MEASHSPAHISPSLPNQQAMAAEQQQPLSAVGQHFQIEQQLVVGVEERRMDEASLQGRVPESDQMIEDQIDIGSVQSKIRKYLEKTQLLHADQEFLKEELKSKQRETLATFAALTQKKKELLRLVTNSYNQQSAVVDIGLSEELEELRKIVVGQQKKIEELTAEINRQGIEGVLIDDKQFKMKEKAESMVNEIKVGKKFSSTQYVRDYLQRPQAYKVSYEESKYEFQLRVRLKDCLQMEKKVYEKKKEEINQLKRKEREREQELLKEKDYWSR